MVKVPDEVLENLDLYDENEFGWMPQALDGDGNRADPVRIRKPRPKDAPTPRKAATGSDDVRPHVIDLFDFSNSVRT